MTNRYPIQSPEHALRAGMVWGMAMRYGLPFVPEVDEDGNYLASATMTLDEPFEGVTVRLVVVPPGEDD